MGKWILCIILVVLVGGSWALYAKKGTETQALKARIDQMESLGDSEEQIPKLRTDVATMEGERTMVGILLTFLSAGLFGIFFVVNVLPFFVQRMTHAVYDSGERVEKDALHSARSLTAQGDYEGAIREYRHAAAVDRTNRMPWVEIIKIHKDHLGDPAGAIDTAKMALESQDWEIDDAAYFMFRIAELYAQEIGDFGNASQVLNQVIELFPESRHSANAKHKLHDLAQAVQEAEVAEYQRVQQVQSDSTSPV